MISNIYVGLDSITKSSNINKRVCRTTRSNRTNPISRVDTSFSVVLSDNDLEGTYYNSSFRCGTGYLIHMYIDFSGNKSTAHDITAQIDLF